MPRITRSQRTKDAQDNNNYNEPDTTNNNNLLSFPNQADIYSMTAFFSKLTLHPPILLSPPTSFILAQIFCLICHLESNNILTWPSKNRLLKSNPYFNISKVFLCLPLIFYKNPIILVTLLIFVVLITLLTQTITTTITTMNLALIS